MHGGLNYDPTYDRLSNGEALVTPRNAVSRNEKRTAFAYLENLRRINVG